MEAPPRELRGPQPRVLVLVREVPTISAFENQQKLWPGEMKVARVQDTAVKGPMHGPICSWTHLL